MKKIPQQKEAILINITSTLVKDKNTKILQNNTSADLQKCEKAKRLESNTPVPTDKMSIQSLSHQIRMGIIEPSRSPDCLFFQLARTTHKEKRFFGARLKLKQNKRETTELTFQNCVFTAHHLSLTNNNRSLEFLLLFEG